MVVHEYVKLWSHDGGDHVFLDACDPRHLACGILDVCKPFDESKVLLRALMFGDVWAAVYLIFLRIKSRYRGVLFSMNATRGVEVACGSVR